LTLAEIFVVKPTFERTIAWYKITDIYMSFAHLRCFSMYHEQVCCHSLCVRDA
jgi:hypothetical protein